VFNSLIEQVFENLPQGLIARSKTMNAAIRLNRRGRLARTFVVLSLAIVAASLFGAKVGAADAVASTGAGAGVAYVEVVVAPGESVWALASRMADDGDVRSLVDQIVSVNSLSSGSVSAGQKLRVPLK
jgi:hypothetical protein